MQPLTGLLLRYFCVATCPQQEMPCPGLRLAAMKTGRGLLRVVPGLRTQCWIASQLAQILGLMSGHEEPLPIRPRMPNALGHEDVRKDRAAEPLPYEAHAEHTAACRLSAELWSDSWRCLKRGLAYIMSNVQSCFELMRNMGHSNTTSFSVNRKVDPLIKDKRMSVLKRQVHAPFAGLYDSQRPDAPRPPSLSISVTPFHPVMATSRPLVYNGTNTPRTRASRRT
jgi:hypothetical protein